MPTVIPVKFAYSAYDLWFDPKATGAQAADHVIVKTERGVEIGLATRDAFEVTPEELGDTTASGRLAPVLRVATASDLEQADNLAIKGEQALPTFRRLVDKSGLDMKPVGVEYLFDGEKVVCYFSAEERVDFRQLVRDLSHELHARIDMRQIGVREEAAIVGGYAHCGQELCCAGSSPILRQDVCGNFVDPSDYRISALNLSNAAAVVLYEALRQTGFPGME